MYLVELCVQMMHVFGIEISPSISTVCRRYGLTGEICQVALQRSSELRGAFMAWCFSLKRDMLVWVDETGSDSRDNAHAVSHPQCTGLYTEDVEQSSGIIALELTTVSYPGRSLKKRPGNLSEFKLLTSAALELAVPIRFQNASCDSCGISFAS